MNEKKRQQLRAASRRFEAKHKERRKTEKRRMSRVRRRWLSYIKKKMGCMDCGYNTHGCALDFDHRPGTVKKFNVCQHPTRSVAGLRAEMAKCDVVCANCHRVRTWRRMNEQT